MICERCKNKCDICGTPIFPNQLGAYPIMADPNKVYCGEVPSNLTAPVAGFLGELMNSVNDCKPAR